MRCVFRLRTACSGSRWPALRLTPVTAYHHSALPAASASTQPPQPAPAAARVTITPLDDIDTFFKSGPTWSVLDSFQRPQHAGEQATDITDEDLQHLGNLTALHVDLSTAHGQQLRRDVKMMVEWLSQLQEVDTEGVEPMWTPLQMIEKLSSTDDDAKQVDLDAVPSPRYRQDQAVQHPNPSELLANAPHTASGYILVPKILGAEDEG